jgi:predicted nucleic acid-binding protein
LKKLFVDTGAFLAKEIAVDQHHVEAKENWRDLSSVGTALYSSEHVLDETMTLLARRTTYAWAADWGRDALTSGISWLRADEMEWKQALRLMQKFADQSVSFTDCVSFVLMRRAGLREVFGFDRHFTAAGFRLRPR